MKAGRRTEKRVAKDTGGREQPGSGNQWKNPGDVMWSMFLIECKETGNDSYQLAPATWRKITNEALSVGKEPAMVISIQGALVAVVPGYLVTEDFIRVPMRTKNLRMSNLMKWWIEGRTESDFLLEPALVTRFGNTEVAVVEYHTFLEMEYTYAERQEETKQV